MSGVLAWRTAPAVTDRLIAAGLAAWALFDVPWWWRPPGHGGTSQAITGLVGLAALQSVPFLRRRRRPAAVLAVTGVALAVKFAAHLNLWSAGVAVLTAAYGLGAYGSRALRLAARVLVAAAIVAAIVALQAIRGSHGAANACALLATALALGEITAAHRDLATSMARKAHDQERANLARDVHDVVAHQLSAIAVQAGAARLAAERDPQAAVTAIAAIERGARGGLDELNALVRQMRQADGPGPPDADDHEPAPADVPGPQPRLGDVPGLIERARQAGLRAELAVDGEARPLAEAIELVGYRVVQEGLTNAIRYAPGASVTVRLGYREAGIQIQVTDEGAAGAGEAAGIGGGAGLAGLRERATLLGGTFEAGRCQQGFAVRAYLPGPT